VRSISILTLMSHTPAKYAVNVAQTMGTYCAENGDDVTASLLFSRMFQIYRTFADANHSITSHFQTTLGDTAKNMLGKCGWFKPNANDSYSEAFRDIASFWSVYFGDTNSTKYALSLFTKNSTAIPADIQRAVYYAATRANSTFDAVSRMFFTSQNNSNLVIAFLAGIPDYHCIETIAHIGDLLDARTALTYFAQAMEYNVQCRDTAWKAFQALSSQLWGQVNSQEILSLLQNEMFATKARLTEVNNWMDDHFPSPVKENFIDTIVQNIQMIQFNS
jgi:hypothetical protein